jgi:DNA-binding response OmpR family regulator
MSKIPKILIVDDDPDIIEILRYNLSLAGYKVKAASNKTMREQDWRASEEVELWVLVNA